MQKARMQLMLHLRFLQLLLFGFLNIDFIPEPGENDGDQTQNHAENKTSGERVCSYTDGNNGSNNGGERHHNSDCCRIHGFHGVGPQDPTERAENQRCDDPACQWPESKGKADRFHGFTVDQNTAEDDCSDEGNDSLSKHLDHQIQWRVEFFGKSSGSGNVYTVENTGQCAQDLSNAKGRPQVGCDSVENKSTYKT